MKIKHSVRRKSVGLGSAPNRICSVRGSCQRGSEFICWGEGEAVTSILSLSQDLGQGSPAVPSSSPRSAPETFKGRGTKWRGGFSLDPLEVTAWRPPLGCPLHGEPCDVIHLFPSGTGPSGELALWPQVGCPPSQDSRPGAQAQRQGRRQGSGTHEH